jgi:hypothetical protein
MSGEGFNIFGKEVCMKHFSAAILLLVLISPLFAQDPNMEPVDQGAMWNSWTVAMRSAYIEGFLSGVNSVYQRAFSYLSAKQRDEIRAATFVVYASDVLAKVVTDLYRDPANTYIEPGALVIVAREKLKGTDIEPLLRAARKNDVYYMRK